MNNAEKLHVRRVFVLGLVLFALGGIVSGFTLGAITLARTNSMNVEKSVLTLPERATVTAVGRPLQPLPLGCPSIDEYVSEVRADGNTPYTLKIHAVDKSGACGTGKALHTPEISAKIWLIHRIPAREILLFPDDQEKLTNIQELAAPFVGQLKNKEEKYPEIPGLQFDSKTPQLQNTNEQGEAQWKYTIQSDLAAGEYDLLILTDWKGRYFSWSWVNINVRQAPAA